MRLLRIFSLVLIIFQLGGCSSESVQSTKKQQYCEKIILSNLQVSEPYVDVSDVKIFLTGQGSYQTTYLEKANNRYRFRITTPENLFPQQATKAKISAALSTFKPLAKFGRHEIANNWEPVFEIDLSHSKVSKILAYRKLEMVDATVDAKCSQSKFSHEIAFTYYLRNQSDGILDCKLANNLKDIDAKLQEYCADTSWN